MRIEIVEEYQCQILAFQSSETSDLFFQKRLGCKFERLTSGKG